MKDCASLAKEAAAAVPVLKRVPCEVPTTPRGAEVGFYNINLEVVSGKKSPYLGIPISK